MSEDTLNIQSSTSIQDNLTERTKSFHRLLLSRVINRSKASANNEEELLVLEKLKSLWEAKLQVQNDPSTSIDHPGLSLSSNNSNNFVQRLLDEEGVSKKARLIEVTEETVEKRIDLFHAQTAEVTPERVIEAEEMERLIRGNEKLSSPLPLLKNEFEHYKPPKKLFKFIPPNVHKPQFDHTVSSLLNGEEDGQSFFASYFKSYTYFLDRNFPPHSLPSLQRQQEHSSSDIEEFQSVQENDNLEEQFGYGFSEMIGQKPPDLLIGMRVYILLTPKNTLLATRNLREELEKDSDFNAREFKLFEGTINAFFYSSTDQIHAINNISESQKKIKGVKIRLAKLLSFYDSFETNLVQKLPERDYSSTKFCESETILHWPTYRLLLKTKESNLELKRFSTKDIFSEMDNANEDPSEELSEDILLEDSVDPSERFIENLTFNNLANSNDGSQHEQNDEEEEDENERLYREYLSSINEEASVNTQNINSNISPPLDTPADDNLSLDINTPPEKTSYIYTLLTREEIPSDAFEEIEKSIITKPVFKLCPSVKLSSYLRDLSPDDNPLVRISPQYLVLGSFIRLKKTPLKWNLLLQDIYVINTKDKTKNFILPSLKLTVTHSESDLLFNQLESKFFNDLIKLSKETY